MNGDMFLGFRRWAAVLLRRRPSIRRRWKRVSKVFFFLLTAACAFSSSASTNVWLGINSSDWGDGANWSLGLPGTNDSILIDGYSLSNYPPLISVPTPTSLLTVSILASNIVFELQLDADGDGQSNEAERLAGTDPLNPDSAFKVINTKIVNGHDVRVDWTTVPGHAYVVQTRGSLTGGQFQDLSPVIFANGTGESITNYVHIGGATNRVQSYRVRLVQ